MPLDKQKVVLRDSTAPSTAYNKRDIIFLSGDECPNHGLLPQNIYLVLSVYCPGSASSHDADTCLLSTRGKGHVTSRAIVMLVSVNRAVASCRADQRKFSSFTL